MKVTVNCNLRGKKLWREGTVLSGPPFPSDIAGEIKAVQEGRSNTLTIVPEETEQAVGEETIALNDLGLQGNVATDFRQKLIQEIDREILFRKFDHSIINRVIYETPKVQYQSIPWFYHEPGARQKRQLLLRKF